MKLLKINNTDCFCGDNYYQSYFTNIDKCVKMCNVLDVNVFIVYNKIVYYRKQSIKECVFNLECSDKTDMYILLDNTKINIKYKIEKTTVQKLRNMYNLDNEFGFTPEIEEWIKLNLNNNRQNMFQKLLELNYDYDLIKKRLNNKKTVFTPEIKEWIKLNNNKQDVFKKLLELNYDYDLIRNKLNNKIYVNTLSNIHTIGDSHSFNGWSNIINHHIGPVLCYSFGRDKLNKCDIRNFNIKDNDTVIFCFGEIDCRCQIYKYVNKTTTYQQIIDNIIENYIEAINLNIKESKLKLKNICIYNVVPAVKKEDVTENPDYPYLGSNEERKQFTLYFNQKLKEKCFENNFIFFDVYDKYIDQEGYLKKDLSDGHVHIKDGIYINDFIYNNLLY